MTEEISWDGDNNLKINIMVKVLRFWLVTIWSLLLNANYPPCVEYGNTYVECIWFQDTDELVVGLFVSTDRTDMPYVSYS